MPVAQFQLPDGRIAEFEVPAGMSDQDIQRAVYPQIQQLLKPVAPDKEPESGVLRQIADVPLGVAKGAVSGTRMLTDIFGAGNVASESLKGIEESITGLMSAQSRNDSREIARIMKEAEDKGFLDQVFAGLKAFGVAPIDMLSQAAGTAIPTIAGGLGARIAGAATAGRVGAGAAVGAGMGAGVTKGSIYDAVKEELSKTGMPADQIEARAQLAQSYGGENLDQILLGTALGGLAATTGIEPALAGVAAKNVLTKAAAKTTAGRVGMGAVAEAAPEFIQASQEQLAQNLALQRQGFDVPLTRGIYGAGTLEALAGAGLGAGVSALTGRPEDAKVEPPKEGEPPKLIGYDPSSQEPMYVFPDGSVAIGEDAARARRYEAQPVEPPAAEPPKLLGYSPTAGQEPMYVFSDGSVAIGEDAAFNRRYEPQKLTQEELSEIAPDLRGVEFTPLKQPPMPMSAELAELERQADEKVAEIKRAERPQTGQSLAGVLKNKLNDSELTDIFGTEKPSYFKSGKKGGRGITISDALSRGLLNDFIPESLITTSEDSPTTALEKQIEAVELIKDKLRDKNYLSEATESELRRLNLDLAGIEQSLEMELNDEQLRQEANELAAELSAEQGLSPIEEAPEEGAVRDIGEPTGPTRIESAADYGLSKRAINALNKFQTSVVEQFGLTPEQADAAFATLRKNKIVSLDPVTGQFNLKDGRFWDREVMLRAAEQAGVKEATPQQREERAIADRERELFALQPQVPERVGAPTGDLFGAEGAQQIQPKKPSISRIPEGQLNLFNSDKDFVENSSSGAPDRVTNIAEAQRVEKALKGKNPLEAAKWMAANATSPDFRLIAKRVVDRMQKLMDAGIPFKLHIVGVGDKVPVRLLGAEGMTSSVTSRTEKKIVSIDIWLNNSTVTGRVGTEEKIVLHELIHAVTAGANYLGNLKSMQGTEAAKLFTRLYDLRNAVVSHFNNRVKSVPRDQLTALEKKVYLNGANALKDEDEVLAWGLTDPDMQEYLESIPYKGKTLWNEFVDAIRQFLGLPKAKETALSEVLAISNLLFEAPLVEAGQTEFAAKPEAAAPATPTAPIPTREQIELFNASIAGMKPSEALKALATKKKAPEEKLTAEGENAKRLMERLGSISNPKPKAADETLLKRLKAIFTPTDNVSFEARIRRAVVDKDAPVIEQLQTQYNNAIKDELGFIRPDLNLMQAQDTSNFADLMAQKGGIEIGVDGMIHVFENKDANGKPINLDRVLELITVDLGKKLGSADLAMQLAHNALIAQRADEINKNNQRIEIRADNMMSAAKSLAKSSDPADKKMAREMRSDAERMLKNRIDVLSTKEEIEAGLEAMRMYPEIREAYDVFTAYKNNLVDFLQDAGRISKLTAENWKQNVGYVPWTRVEEEANKFELDPRTFKNGVINLSALPKLDKEGSTKEINNIFDNMVGLTYWAVRSGINNFAAQRTLNTLPDVEVIPDEEGRVAEMRKRHPDRVVFSYKNGEREAYLLANPFQLATFSTIAPLKGGMFSAVFAPAARFLRATITHMPAFAISQLVQDGTYRAALLSGVKNPWKLPPKVFKNFYKALRKQKEGALGELERLGVSGIYDGMPESTAERLRIRNGLEHRNAFKKAWDALEDFSLSADLAVRAAIYEQTMAETGDRALAYYRAKEYINFKRQGTDPIVYELRQSIPFFNAYLQGMDVLYRTMIGKGVSTAERKAAMKLFYMTGMQIAALNLLYAMMMSGDDDYEGLDDYVRNRNYILPGGFKIPVAPEVGFLFKVIPEQLYRATMAEGVQTPQDATAVAKRMTGAFADAFGGVEYLPQLIKPVVELSTNYSFFLESPIVGAGFKNVESAQQFTESTSELAKTLGGMTNISPMKLDYFIRAYTGMAGALGLDLTDSLMNPDRMGKPIYKTPQISTFMYDPTGRGFKSDFYKFREEVDKVADTVNMMKREGRVDELATYLTEENAVRFALRGMVNKVEGQLSNLRNYRKVIAADTTLTPAERREMTREILDQERELIKAYDVKELRKIAGF